MDLLLGIKVFVVISLVVVIIFGIAVAVQYGISHLYAWSIDADEIHCNWLWCDVRKTYSEIDQRCYIDGEPINCSEITSFI